MRFKWIILMKQNICKSFLNYFSLISILVTFLTACGGGSDDKPKINLPVVQNADGVWYGNYTTPDGVSYPAKGLMNDGSFVLSYVDDGLNYSIGNYSTIISNIILSSSKYEAGIISIKGAGSLDGVVYSKGTMLLDTSEGGQYSLVYSSQESERPISIEILEGSLPIFAEDAPTRIFVDSSGNIFNDDSFNCDFSGDIRISDNQENILLMDVVISGDNCIHRGVYSGLGTIAYTDNNVERFFEGYFHNGINGYAVYRDFN